MAAKKSLQARIKAGDQSAIRQALKNPKWRRYVPQDKLPTSLRQHRQANVNKAALNKRLDTPITPGSSLTERDLAQQTNAAADVRYGPLEAEQKRDVGMSEAAVRDVGGWYDQYLQQLQAHQKAVQDIGAQAAQQAQGTMAGVTGLAGADLSQLQGQANQGAAQRGTQAADLTQMASNAAATRQALLGSFAAQQSATNAANTGYASDLAQVVAPGQKLQAIGQGALKLREARQKQTDTARERGAWIESERATRRADEAKNVLAEQVATGKTAAELAKAKLQSSTSIKTAKIRASTQLTTAQMNKEMKDADRKAKAGQPNKYGIPADQWNRWSTSHRQRVINNFAAKKNKTKTAAQQFEAKYGVKPATTEAVGRAQGSIGEAKTWLGRLGGNLDEAGRNLSAGVPAGKNSDGTPRPAVPKIPAIFVRVAMDQRRMNGYISASTADRLHRAGYSVPGLGLKTKPGSPVSANTRAYGGQRNLGRTGHL